MPADSRQRSYYMEFKFNLNLKYLIISIIAAALIIVLIFFIKNMLTAKPRETYNKIDIERMQEICKRATIELDYNDVAKVSAGYWFFKKRNKQLWIEHKVLVKIGIDESKLEVSEENDKQIIYIPKAEILNVYCDPESFTEDSFSIEKTIFRKVSAKEQNTAMSNAIKEIKNDAEGQSECLRDAQKRAAKLIENDLEQLQIQTSSIIQYEIRLR